jgi:hypothetical protein
MILLSLFWRSLRLPPNLEQLSLYYFYSPKSPIGESIIFSIPVLETVRKFLTEGIRSVYKDRGLVFYSDEKEGGVVGSWEEFDKRYPTAGTQR